MGGKHRGMLPARCHHQLCGCFPDPHPPHPRTPPIHTPQHPRFLRTPHPHTYPQTYPHPRSYENESNLFDNDFVELSSRDRMHA